MKKTSVHGVMPLIIFALFAALLLTVLAAGATGYRALTQRDDAAFSQRTAAQYLRAKILFCPDSQQLRVEAFGDVDALVIASQYGEEVYLTKLYCYNGFLYELFSPEGILLSPQDGEALLPLSAMRISSENGLLSLELSWEEASHTLLIAPRNTKEVRS